MANTVTFSGHFQSKLTTTETFSGADTANNTVTLDGDDEDFTLTGTTTPAITKVSRFTITLSAGAATLDLTAIPGLTPNETIDGTGLKVQAIKFTPSSGNANPITASKGGTNGYGLTAAGTTWSIPMDAGQSSLRNTNNAAPAIGGSAKTIDFAGTGSQTIKVTIWLG